VAALAQSVFITHAEPGGKTEQFCQEVLSWGKPVLTFKSNENAHLVGLGAMQMNPGDVAMHTWS